MFATAMTPYMYLDKYNECIIEDACSYSYVYGNINTYPALIKTEQEKILECIDNLKNININKELTIKINEYENEMKELLKIYDKKNNNVFKNDNFSLYADIQHQLSIIIDIQYDIIENIIKTKNKNNVIQILDIIIKNHKSIIEDINNTVIPDVNI